MSSEPPTPPPASGATPHSPDPMPASPISAMMASAIGLHEGYRSYVDAGFTEEQAFEILLIAIRAFWRAQ